MGSSGSQAVMRLAATESQGASIPKIETSPAVGRQQARHHAQGRRLAGAVRSEQRREPRPRMVRSSGRPPACPIGKGFGEALHGGGTGFVNHCRFRLICRGYRAPRGGVNRFPQDWEVDHPLFSCQWAGERCQERLRFNGGSPPVRLAGHPPASGEVSPLLSRRPLRA